MGKRIVFVGVGALGGYVSGHLTRAGLHGCGRDAARSSDEASAVRRAQPDGFYTLLMFSSDKTKTGSPKLENYFVVLVNIHAL